MDKPGDGGEEAKRNESVPFYEWSNSMSVGVPLIDSDHQALVGLINRLHETLGDGGCEAAEVFDSLIAYLEIHLAREERVMEACKFPGLREQRDDHAGFINTVYEARDRYDQVADPAILAELLVYLKSWFRNHVLSKDVALRRFAAADPRANEVAEIFGPGLSDMDPAPPLRPPRKTGSERDS